MKYIILIFIILNFQILNALTLEDSVNKAIQNNPSITYSKNNLEQNKIILNKIKSTNYPELFLNANLGKQRTNSSTTLYKNESSNVKEYTISLKQNIFSGYKTENTIKEQENMIMKSYSDFNTNQNDITQKVTNAYYNIIKNKKLLKVSQNNVIVIKNIYKNIKKSYKSGFAILSDVKKVEATLQNAKYQVLAQVNAIQDWKNTLEYYTASSIDDTTLIDDTIKREIPKTLKKALKIAMENNPELLSTRYTSQANLYKYESSKSNKYPTVDLFLDKTKSGDSNSNYGTTDQLKLYLSLNYKLSFGNEQRYERESKVKEYKKSLNNLELEKNKLKYHITKVWEKLDILNKQKKHLEYYYTYAQSTIDLFQQEYNIGNRKLLDLLIAQADFVTAKSNLISANYDYKIQVFELLSYMGKNIKVITEHKKTINTYHHIDEIVYSESYKKALLDPKNANKYVINLAIYEYRENLRKLIFRHDFQNKSYAYKISSTNLMKAVYGLFNTRKEALNEIKKYNEKAITNNVPYVTKVKVIQDNIKVQ
jgi:adhesin transport system outer membrane protein